LTHLPPLQLDIERGHFFAKEERLRKALAHALGLPEAGNDYKRLKSYRIPMENSVRFVELQNSEGSCSPASFDGPCALLRPSRLILLATFRESMRA